MPASSRLPLADRPTCYRCFKPAATCICTGLPRVDNRTEVVVYQHPRERFHPLGTARFVQLGLERSRVETLRPRAVGPRPSGLDDATLLLYPSRHARDLGDVLRDEKPRRLVVLDGTWHHARTMYRDAWWLHDLQCVKIAPQRPSRYRIRREPRADCLSTVEAIAEALRAIEPDVTGLDDLLAAFDEMIEQQVQWTRRHGTRRRTRVRPARLRGLPRAFADSFDRLVLVYGESVLARHEVRGSDRQLVQWAAVRPSTGEVFEALIRPEGELVHPRHVVHLEIPTDDLGSGSRYADLAGRWTAFARPDDVLVAWNHSTVDLLPTPRCAPSNVLLLKSICRSVWPESRGALEDVVDAIGLGERWLPLRGRAARRLGNALAVVAELQAQLDGESPGVSGSNRATP